MPFFVRRACDCATLLLVHLGRAFCEGKGGKSRELSMGKRQSCREDQSEESTNQLVEVMLAWDPELDVSSDEVM